MSFMEDTRYPYGSRPQLVALKISRPVSLVSLFALSNGHLDNDAVLLGDPDDSDLRAVGFTPAEARTSYEGPGSSDDV
jgi:hypothetical protein